jgi:hypothetical protein
MARPPLPSYAIPAGRVGTIAAYALGDARSCAVLALASWVLGLVHPALAEALLLASAFGAASRVASGHLGAYRPDLHDVSEVGGSLGFGLAALLAGSGPLLALGVFLPAAGASSRAGGAVTLGRGAVAEHERGIVHAQDAPAETWEFGDFGVDGRAGQSPPKTGAEAEQEALAFAEFEEGYAARERLLEDPEEGDDEYVADGLESAASAPAVPVAALAVPSEPAPASAPAASPRPRARIAAKPGPVAAEAGPVVPLRALWLAALVWSFVYTPVALGVAVGSRSVVRTLDPIAGLQTIAEGGARYAAALGLACVVLVVRFLLGASVGPAPFVGGLVRAVLGAYALLAVGCTLGFALAPPPPRPASVAFRPHRQLD